MDSWNGTAQGICGPRVSEAGKRQVHVHKRTLDVYSEFAWKHDAIEPLKFTRLTDQVDVVITAQWRRSWRPG